MSTPSLLSEFSPLIRSRPINATLMSLNQRSRSALHRSKPRSLRDEILAFYARQCEGLPDVPSYLTNTIYAQLLQQQFILFNKRLNLSKTSEARKAQPVDEMDYEQAKIPTETEYAALESLVVQHRYNFGLAVQDLRLPSMWDLSAKGEYVEVSPDRMQLTYLGNGKDDSDVSSVKANHAMRRQCGIYYFEIQIISKGMDGHIGIGFCRERISTTRFPGWEEHSWGYHGENGHTFCGPGTGKAYGPKYGTGDIIGCGIDFRDMTAFYTKNGIFLGTAFRKIKETDLFPFVGFKTPGERIEANFGKRPFKFDIEQYVASANQELLNKIALKPIDAANKSPSAVVNQATASSIADKVVVEFLRHSGYINSANALEEAVKLKSEQTIDDVELDVETIHRQEIRELIIEGEIDTAIELCNTYYPTVLEKNPWVNFKLQCRKFMEMVKRAQNITLSTSNEEYEAQSYEAQNLQVAQNHPNKRSPTKANLDVYNYKKKKFKASTEDQGLGSFQAVMSFGNLLKQRYGPESESNEAMKKELTSAFSTLAYADLSNKAVSYLYETPYTEIVASELNSAILVSLDRYPNSSLERIYRQTKSSLEELVLGGNAEAALLEPERDCLKLSDS